MERNRSLFHSDDVSIKLVHGKLINITSSGPVWQGSSSGSIDGFYWSPPKHSKSGACEKVELQFCLREGGATKTSSTCSSSGSTLFTRSRGPPNRPSDHRAVFCSNFPGFVRLHLKGITLITQVLKCLLWIIMTDEYARCSSCKGLFGKVYFSFNITCFTQIETRETRWIYVFLFHSHWL